MKPQSCPGYSHSQKLWGQILLRTALGYRGFGNGQIPTRQRNGSTTPAANPAVGMVPGKGQKKQKCLNSADLVETSSCWLHQGEEQALESGRWDLILLRVPQSQLIPKLPKVWGQRASCTKGKAAVINQDLEIVFIINFQLKLVH